ncbi:MAG: hypothetical protein U9R41_01290 [Candidatus Marinimicrobia bacterium]|nr:hypothetical protein [Candidatus Neomarinimicrobiota bacterium]
MKNITKNIFILILIICNNLFGETILVIGNDSTVVNLDKRNVERILDSKVKKFVKKGYPYAKIILEKYKTENEDNIFKYRIQKGEYVTIDTIVYGKYKQREINIIERDITELPLGEYNYLKVNKAINDLKQIEYLSVSNRKNIYKTGLRLYTEPKNQTKLDALFTYKKERDESGIIGNLSIEMQNLFGLGRRASLSWYRPNLKTNRIKLNYYEPYIFNSGFSVKGEYFQDFHDTLYVKRDIDLHIYYQFNPKLQFGYINSLENIYSTEGGENIGIKSMKKYGTSIRLDGIFGNGILVNYFVGEIGMKSNNDDKMYFSTISSDLIIRYKKFGTNIKVKYGIVDSKSEIQIYDLIKLGGADFLRGAYFEQYLTEEYLGFSFEFGIFSGESNIFAFYDLGLLRELTKPTHHIGLSVKLPTGKSSISLTIGFNIDESYENGKVHLRWNL